MAMNPIALRLGSRGSPLALTQARLVAKMLADLTGAAAADFPIETFVTSGDRILDRRLTEDGGKGLFTKELDEALLDRRIDIAVHSLKDLPTRMPPGIMLAAIPAREDPRDAFISHKAKDLMALPQGAVIGTASLRRQAQALHARPDLKVVPLRGSVETRLKKLEAGTMDATFLALAGMKRLGLARHATSLMDATVFPPAPGQGALAVTCRDGDDKTAMLLDHINRSEFAAAITAERAFLEALDGSCRTPIGALAICWENTLDFRGEVLTPDGVHCWRRQQAIALVGNARKAVYELGFALGRSIREEAGDRFAAHIGDLGW